uniref:Transcription factor 24 n=1 Tax=Mastacembelus armatus TaxID=205130 RepID=A0A7N9AP63_9TELE
FTTDHLNDCCFFICDVILQVCKCTLMVGRQIVQMESANCSGVVVDDSPIPRARVLQTVGLGGRGRPAAANAARERSRVQTLRNAFLELQRTLPSVPPDTKLSKLDVLILATTYIAHLTRTLQEEEGYLHPVKVSHNNNNNDNDNNNNNNNNINNNNTTNDNKK